MICWLPWITRSNWSCICIWSRGPSYRNNDFLEHANDVVLIFLHNIFSSHLYFLTRRGHWLEVLIRHDIYCWRCITTIPNWSQVVKTNRLFCCSFKMRNLKNNSQYHLKDSKIFDKNQQIIHRILDFCWISHCLLHRYIQSSLVFHRICWSCSFIFLSKLNLTDESTQKVHYQHFQHSEHQHIQKP